MNKLDKQHNPKDIKYGDEYAKMKIPPPKPPKDRVLKEPSWLETLTFGLYKTKKYIKRNE
jgi:hypothetical protein